MRDRSDDDMDDMEITRQHERWEIRRALVCFPIILISGIFAIYSGITNSEGGFTLGMLVMAGTGFYLWATNRTDHRPIIRNRLAGSYLKKLSQPQEGSGIPIGLARMPENVEALHTVIEGATGRGKTQILKNMIDHIRQRGDTLIVVDSNYDLHKTFGRPDDVVLSIFDDRSPGWEPRNEIRKPADWATMARSLIGEGEGNSKEWHAMAKALFASIGKRYEQECIAAGQPFDNTEFFHLLNGASSEVLEPLLHGTTAASLIGNERGLSSVRMTFLETLTFWDHLRPGDFSVRDWVDMNPAERPSIFIPHRKSELGTSKNVISCWLDWLINTACDLGEDDRQRVWIVIDELSSLGQIGSLKTAVTELRKSGFRVIVGIQDYAQVESIYGRTGATTILNNLSNKVVLGVNDSVTAERLSKTLGDARNRVFSYSTSSGSTSSGSTSGTSSNVSDQVETVVLPSEIMALPPLEAFVKWSGTDRILKTKIDVYKGRQAT